MSAGFLQGDGPREQGEAAFEDLLWRPPTCPFRHVVGSALPRGQAWSVVCDHVFKSTTGGGGKAVGEEAETCVPDPALLLAP